MLQIISFVRYSNASLKLDSNFLLGTIIFFLICGIFIFQYQIWNEEEYSRNEKLIKWKASAIKANKSDLTKFYPSQKN